VAVKDGSLAAAAVAVVSAEQRLENLQNSAHLTSNQQQSTHIKRTVSRHSTVLQDIMHKPVSQHQKNHSICHQ